MELHICTDRQKILDEQGHVLVTGGPGCGKTTIALKKALSIIEVDSFSTQKVLFLSFSRAAVNRIVETAKGSIPEKHLERLDVQTFHSFFWRIIKTHAYLLGHKEKLSLLLPADEKSLSGGIKDSSPEWSDWLLERDRLFHEEHKIAFDHFSSTAHALLSGSKRITELLSDLYPTVIVDEAQDTDQEQWSCVEYLAKKSQIICLADIDQQIYDYRPGIDAGRIDAIKTSIDPLCIDLGEQNNRSPDSEILSCGKAIVEGEFNGETYSGVSRILYSDRQVSRDKKIRQAYGMICRAIEKQKGVPPESIAILATTNRGVAVVTNALRGKDSEKHIAHKVLFDEAVAVLSSRVIAFLLEPKNEKKQIDDLVIVLELLSCVSRAKGTKKGSKDHLAYSGYAKTLIETGKCRQSPVVKSIEELLGERRVCALTGDPRADWMCVRKMLRNSKSQVLVDLDQAVRYLVSFNRGKLIANNLANSWMENGSYVRAMQLVETSLTQDQLMSDESESSGLHVMTMHKSKGKQYDGVILFHSENICPFNFPGDEGSFMKSRKLLRVGVTRASVHALFLTSAAYPPDLIQGLPVSYP